MKDSLRNAHQPISALEIGQIECCKSLDLATRTNIAAHSSRRNFDAGAIIVQPKDRSTDVYFMISGRVRVNNCASTGRQVTYRILAPGQIFGELAAIDGMPRSAGVEAEDSVSLGKVTAEDFRDLLLRHPDFSSAIMHRLTSLSRKLTEKLFEYHTYDVRGRIYAELLRLHDQNATTELCLTDRDMASRVGTTRENVTRIYAKLKQAGILARSATRLSLLDVEHLRELLGECEFG